MSGQKNVEYDEPYEQEEYKTFSHGENGEMGCKTCGSLFCDETFDEEDTQQYCSKCNRVLCPYCDEGEQDHENEEDSDSGEDILCVYCATGRLSVNDLAKAFIALAKKKGKTVGDLYKKATS